MARTRSPNYPYIGLPTAIERVQTIYNEDHRNRMSRDVVAKHLGYSGLTGISMSVISAIGKYGLLESIAADLQISQDAVTILVDTPDSEERAQALRRAAFKPDLFAELHKHYGGQIPSSANLIAHLQKAGFTANAATQAAKSYLETLSLVSPHAGAYDNGKKPEANSVEADRPHTSERQQKTVRSQQLESEQEEFFRSKLSPNTTAVVLITGPAGPKEIDKLIRLLTLQKEVMQEDGVDDVNGGEDA